MKIYAGMVKKPDKKLDYLLSIKSAMQIPLLWQRFRKPKFRMITRQFNREGLV